MAAEYIHVKIGLTDAVYPMLELITTGPFNGFYHYSTSPTTTAWTHKRWCTPCAADGTPIADTESQGADWRKFLRDHWDTERNHCKVEHLDEFYRIFRVWYIRQWLGHVVNPISDLIGSRYRDQLFTFITTNLTPREIRQKYGNRVADRFNEMTEPVVFENDTYRHNKLQV